MDNVAERKRLNLPSFPSVVPGDHMSVRVSAWRGRRKAKLYGRELRPPEVPELAPDLKVKVQKTGVWRKRQKNDARRGSISRFSFDSKRRLEQAVRGTADLWESALTLTYPDEYTSDGERVKEHLAAFLAWLRRQKVAYLWVLEFQERGAPHFHFLLRGWLPLDVWEKDGKRVRVGTHGAVQKRVGLETTWFRIVASGDERHRRAGTEIHAIRNASQAGHYVAKQVRKLKTYFPAEFGSREALLKYVAKEDQKAVPEAYQNVGRFWGCSRMMEQVIVKTDALYRDAKATLSPLLKGYESKCAGWGIKWEWKGAGFVFIGGADLFTTMLRQATKTDAGESVWTDWDGKPDEREQFVSPAERLKGLGQFTLDGAFEPTFPEEEFE